MTPFRTHSGIVAALPRVNVDTDQIIPKQFLKRVERTGFGPALFHDWRYRADGTPDPAFALNHPRAAGATILLTEDHRHVREIMAESLEAAGYEVVQAETGDELLNRLASDAQRFDLLIVDLDIPGPNGLDCLQQLRAQGVRIPAVLVTGTGAPVRITAAALRSQPEGGPGSTCRRVASRGSTGRTRAVRPPGQPAPGGAQQRPPGR